jgi:site-specific recombinase XerD
MHLTDCFAPFDRYLSACGSAKNTRESYQRTLRKFEKFLELSDRSCEVEQLKKEDVIGFLAGCEEAGEKRSSVILRLVICKKFFGWLRAEKQIAEDPAAGIPVPKERKRIPRYLSPAQVEALLSQPEIDTPCGLRDRALLELLYSAGLRISEALSMELQDIDYEHGFIYVRNGKGGKPRSVPVGVTALQWLQRYILEGRKKLEVDCSSLVFLSRSGQQLSRQSAAAAIRSYTAVAGLPVWVCGHALRHACATHMLEGGAKLPYIQEHLGHAMLESTRIYLAVRSEELKIVHSNCHPRK